MTATEELAEPIVTETLEQPARFRRSLLRRERCCCCGKLRVVYWRMVGMEPTCRRCAHYLCRVYGAAHPA